MCNFAKIMLVVFIFLAQDLWSQSTESNDNKFIQGALQLKSRNVAFQKKDFSSKDIENEQKKRFYVKFRQSPHKTIKKNLLKAGISQLDYIGNNTYIVELNQQKLSFLKKQFFIEGFAEIELADKMTDILFNKKFDKLKQDKGYINVTVTFYENISFAEAIGSIRSVGGIIESKQLSRTNKLRVLIHPLNIVELANATSVKYIEEISPEPIDFNIQAGKLSNVFWDNDGGTISGLFDQDYRTSPPVTYALSGDEINVAVKDGGAVYARADFENRLTIVDNETISDHATHVAGTIGALLSVNDNDGNTGGMADNVKLFSFCMLNETDYTEDFVTAITTYSAKIINNSWGIPVGWDLYFYGGYWGWFWMDNLNLFGDYTSDSQDFDDFMYDYYDDHALLIKAAGNNRDDYGIGNPHDGTLYGDEYFYCMPPISCAKNIITVGSIGTEEADCDSSPFSSFGPTNEGRIKPDIVADGWALYSTPDNDGAYYKKSGTSMSCPVVTGICALIHEAYNDEYGEYPTADIVKALLCNYAIDLPYDSPDGPDFRYGFGLVDAKACIDAIFNLDASPGGHIATSEIGEEGGVINFQFYIEEGVNDNESIKITLTWIDPPGDPSVENALVNDLDLYVSCTGQIHNSYYFRGYDDFNEAPIVDQVDPSIPAKNDGISKNRYDTVEQVVIVPPENDTLLPGIYNVQISADNIHILDQPFAVVSSVGFESFNFNTLKIKDANGDWVSNYNPVLGETPDVLLMVTDLDNEGFNPLTFQYSYSIDDSASWNGWYNVTGVYEDKECLSSYDGTTKVAYILVQNVPFNNISSNDNKIKFKVSYDGTDKFSPVYTIKNNNIYYVWNDNDSASDTYPGTKEQPWKTLQHAINSVVATSDVPAIIKVREGTYEVDCGGLVLGDYIELYGGYNSIWNRDIENAPTVIKSVDTTRVITLDESVVLDGFTIEDGQAWDGGGVYSNYDNIKILNCIIKNCDADAKGGGLYIEGNNVVINNCVISNNTAQLGGGIYLNDCSVELQDCVIKNNSTYGGVITYDYFHDYNYYGRAHGGGMLLDDSDVTIKNCFLESNTSNTLYSFGGCIFSIGSNNTKIINSIFKSNSAAGPHSIQSGGAIYCDVNSPQIEIIGCIFYQNSGKQGGTIFCYGMTLTNCTVYNNTSTSGANIWTNSGGSQVSITNCIIWGNTGDDFLAGDHIDDNNLTYSCIDNDSYNGTGIIHDNPQFKDPSNGDFSLKITSPCIDAGYDSATGLNLLSEDIAKNPRVFEFDSSKTNSVDMGAYEYRWNFTQAYENDGEITLEWESLDNDTYYVYYTDHELMGTISPILHYKMNDDDNDAVIAESINSFNGIFMDNEGEIHTEDYSSEGKINTALSFNGNRYIDCGNRGNITSDISITAWVHLTDSVVSRNIVTKAWNNAYRFRVSTDRKLWFLINDGTSYEVETSDSTISTGQWVHVAVTADFTSQEVKFYINGQLDTTESTSKTAIASSNNDLLIGAYSHTPAEPWKGYIDDIRIYDVVLETEDVANIYNQGDGSEEINPLTWTKVQQGITGQTDTTLWTDDGSETSPPPDNEGVISRFYKVVFEN